MELSDKELALILDRLSGCLSLQCIELFQRIREELKKRAEDQFPNANQGEANS